MLRKSDNPLQQIVKRLAELENLLMAKGKRESSDSTRVSRTDHDEGPLLAELRFRSIKQYKELRVGPWHLSCKIPDSFIYLNDHSVVCLQNIVKTDDSCLLLGRRFRQKSDLYS